MLNKDTIKIKKINYTVTKMSNTDGFPACLTLAKYISKPLTEALSYVSKKEDDNKSDESIMLLGMAKYLSEISVENMIEITGILLNPKYIKIEEEMKVGEELKMIEKGFSRDHFGADYGSQLRFMIFIIKFNFMDFFSEITTIFQEIMPNIQSQKS